MAICTDQVWSNRMCKSSAVRKCGVSPRDWPFQSLPAATKTDQNRKSGRLKKSAEPCKRFCTTGNIPLLCPIYHRHQRHYGKFRARLKLTTYLGRCAKGPRCPYTHNPSTVAVCAEFLKSGNCPAGDACDLSHDLIPERTPACLHFLKGKCTNDPCRYAHVRVNPSAPVCKDFAHLGYCSKGVTCEHRHVHECPSYANAGICRNPKCRLPHVDRAGQLRKQAAQLDAIIGQDENDISSNDDISETGDSDDVDSDGLEEEPILSSENLGPSQISRNEDFVGF